VGNIAKILAKTTAAIAAGLTVAALTEAVRECMKSPVLQLLRGVIPFLHPCETLPMYSPGVDLPRFGGSAAQHRLDAIAARPTWGVQRYASPAERDLRVPGERWYRNQPGCTAADKTTAQAKYPGVPLNCDEYPNWAMSDGGKGASITFLPFDVNQLEGVRLGTFYGACPKVSDAAVPVNGRDPFLVVPRPFANAGPTLWTCGS